MIRRIKNHVAPELTPEIARIVRLEIRKVIARMEQHPHGKVYDYAYKSAIRYLKEAMPD